jgi:hypothetical protein
VDAEVFHDDDENPDDFIDLTPALNAAMQAAAREQSSPLVAHAARRSALLDRLNQVPLPQSRQAAEAQATRIVSGVSVDLSLLLTLTFYQVHDVLEEHQAKRRRKGPTAEYLAAVASRIFPAPPAPDAPAPRAPAPRAPDAPAPRAPAPRAPAPRAPDAPAPRNANAPAGRRAHRNRAVSAPANASDAIAAAAREADDYEQEVLDTRKRKRVSQPAPHHIGSRTPNTRIVLKKGKEDYSFSIVVRNAYPNPHERLVAAREAHEVAIQAAPDAASVASGVQWSPSKLRLYADMGWVRRGVTKAAASSHVPIAYRLAIPPNLAEQLAGGATPANVANYIRTRVNYLLDQGAWLRGRHATVCLFPIFMQRILTLYSILLCYMLTPLLPT